MAMQSITHIYIYLNTFVNVVYTVKVCSLSPKSYPFVCSFAQETLIEVMFRHSIIAKYVYTHTGGFCFITDVEMFYFL